MWISHAKYTVQLKVGKLMSQNSETIAEYKNQEGIKEVRSLRNNLAILNLSKYGTDHMPKTVCILVIHSPSNRLRCTDSRTFQSITGQYHWLGPMKNNILNNGMLFFGINKDVSLWSVQAEESGDGAN